MDDAFLPPNKKDILLEVLMCSATVCEHCSSILYDEDIMSGWSAQDSDLNTALVALLYYVLLKVGEVITLQLQANYQKDKMLHTDSPTTPVLRSR